MSKYSSYDQMKDSGIEWLGEIPEHWGKYSFRNITRILTDYTANGSFKSLRDNVHYLDEPGYARLVRLTDIRKEFKNDGVYVSKEAYDFLSKSTLYGGEFLIANVGAYAGLICPMPDLDMPATLGPNMMLAKFDEDKVLNRFMIWAGESSYIKDQLKLLANSSSAQPSLNKDDFRSVKFISPPLKEQKLIVDFLDRETGKIDKLIEKKEKLIELLEEKRQATISEVVTKGLDSDVEIKDSGVEWLGEIPEYWEVGRLKFYIKLNPTKIEIKNSSDDLKATFLPMKNIYQDGSIDTSEEKLVGEVGSRFTYFSEGDVLLAKITPCFENGKSAIARNLKNKIGFGTTEVQVLRTNNNSNKEFIYYLINSNSFMEIGESRMTGSAGQKRVPTEFIKNFRQGFPPLEEQEEIANYLDQETNRIDSLIEKTKEQIANLKEYKQALISNAITGKIKVIDN